MSNYAFRNSSTTTAKEQYGTSPGRTEHTIGNQEQQELLAGITPERIVSEALNWGGLMLTKADEIENSALSDVIPTKDMGGVFAGASALMTGVQSFQDSPNQTLMGRGLDALLDVSGSLMVGANPVVGAVDSFLPKEFKLSNLYDGTSSAVSSIAEGVLTNDTTAMEGFMEKAKDGDYSIFVQEAVEAGEFWSKQMD